MTARYQERGEGAAERPRDEGRHVVDNPVHLPALMFDRGAGLAAPAIVLPFGR